MYYNFVYSFQYPPLLVPFPMFVLGMQTQLHDQRYKFQSNQNLEEKGKFIKDQEQPSPTPTLIMENHQKRFRKANQLIKKQENTTAVTSPKLKKKRQADSFTQRRNILPNNINHILAFIQRKSKSEHLVDRIIQKSDRVNTFTSKRYYCYQTYLKQKLHIHVNKETLSMIANHLELTEDIFTVQEQLFYNRVCRILISYYIRETAKLKILSSARVKCTNKHDHLRAHRTLFQYLVGNLDQ